MKDESNDKKQKKGICNFFSYVFQPSAFSLQPSGFTLIELIIVLIIIGIGTALAGLLITGNSGGLEIKTFTKDVSAVLRYARSQAVSEKRTYCFVIDRNERIVRLYAVKPKEEVEGDEEAVVVISKAIPETLQMTLQDVKAEPLFIEFFPWGNSTGGVIEVSNPKGLTYFISVNRLSGKVEITKAEG
ncbi:MAG: prepilin-type N-terminal cleavage/methylation domain-containing protein [Nitrospirae bacterium]|nr:prepilin-type N-terminal cleavage/methylation domain-containing protein [Nitrospirota bacterium]